MNITNALRKWGYKPTRTNQELLKQICRRHPEICTNLSPVDIKKGIRKIYLPDRRTKDTYLHIVRAVHANAHLYPESIDLTEEKIKVQLSQLCRSGIIEKNNGRSAGSTENYDTTLQTEMWLRMRKYQRVRALIKIAEPLKPQFNGIVGIGL